MVLLLPSQATKQIAVYSPEVSTSITIVAPNEVYAGASFNIGGNLTRDDGDSPLASQPVKLYAGTTLLATATTNATGSYSFNATIAAEGSYTLKAVFEGADIGGYIKRLNGSQAKTTIGKQNLDALKPYIIPAVIVATTAYLLKKI